MARAQNGLEQSEIQHDRLSEFLEYDSGSMFDLILEHARRNDPYCHADVRLISKQFYAGVKRNLEKNYTIAMVEK